MPALRLRLRTTCVTCGNPIPLTSAHLPLTCPSCDAASMLSPSEFGWVVSAGLTSRQPGEGAALLGEVEPSEVKCGACQALVDDAAIDGAVGRGEIDCRCGHSIGVRAIPAELDGARWWSALVGESTRGPATATSEPIHFPCPNCGGALLVDAATRTPACRHCGKRAYLPDDLWRALRPTPRAEPFYLWVDPAWFDVWDAKRRNGNAGAALSAIALYCGAGVAAFLWFQDSDIVGGVLGLAWMPAWLTGSLVKGALAAKRPLRDAQLRDA